MIAMAHHAPDYKAEVFKVIGKGITIYVVMYCAVLRWYSEYKNS